MLILPKKIITEPVAGESELILPMPGLQEDSPDAQETSLRSAIAAYFHNDLADVPQNAGVPTSTD